MSGHGRRHRQRAKHNFDVAATPVAPAMNVPSSASNASASNAAAMSAASNDR